MGRTNSVSHSSLRPEAGTACEKVAVGVMSFYTVGVERGW